MKKLVLTAMVVATGGAYSLQNAKADAGWTARYARSYDSLANCIAERASGGLQVSPQIDQGQGAIILILSVSGPGGPAVLGELSVTRLAERSSRVSWTSVGPAAGEQQAYEARARTWADRCGDG